MWSPQKIHQVKQVIDTSPETARARLLLFYCAKKVLAEGMIVLGIEPLDRVWLWPQMYISISWSTTFDDEGYLRYTRQYNFNKRGHSRSSDVSKIAFSSKTGKIVCCASLSLDKGLWLCDSARWSCKYLKLGSFMPLATFWDVGINWKYRKGALRSCPDH